MGYVWSLNVYKKLPKCLSGVGLILEDPKLSQTPGPWASAGTTKDQTLDLVPEVVAIQKCRRNHGHGQSNQGKARKMQHMIWIRPSEQHAQTRFFASHPRMNQNTGSFQL